jgi:hypothetical protein
MARFLIEIPHSENVAECMGIIQVFLTSGSHLLSNAEWGCKDGVHTAYLIAELESKDEALCLVPPAFRREARVVELSRFSLDFINESLERLKAERSG